MSTDALPPPQDLPPPHVPPAGDGPLRGLGGTRSLRLKVFLSVFLVTLAIGLGIILLKTPAYQARATVELRPSDDPADADGPVDFQFLLTQVQNMTSRSILEGVVERMGGETSGEEGKQALNRLEDALRVEPVQGTALVHVSGTGEDPQLLVLMVNTVLDVFAESLREKRTERSNDSSFALRRQVLSLQRSITEKRRELGLFQDDNDITSLEREENEVLTRVKALAEDRDEAAERARQKAARLEQLQSNSDSAMSEADALALAALTEQIGAIEADLAARAQIYTRRHMALDPDVRSARSRLAGLKQRAASMEDNAQKQALQRAIDADKEAQLELRRVESELQAQKLVTQQFTARFKQFKVLNTELDELTARNQKLRNQLTRLELNRAAEIPRMDVLETAKLPTRANHTETLRDAGIVTAIALLLALFAVWLVEFLSRSKQDDLPPPTQVSVAVSGGPQLTHNGQQAPVLESTQQPKERLVGGNASRLDHQASPAPTAAAAPVAAVASVGDGERVLDGGELQALWNGSPAETRVVLGLLLNGASPAELLQLRGSDLDMTQSELGIGDRIVPLSPALHQLMAGLPPVYGEQALISAAVDDLKDVAELDALLACAAVDGGLSAPTAVTANTIQHSYLVYLVGQGVRLGELKRVAGPINPTQLTAYAAYSPPGAGCGLEDIDPFLPFLVTTAP